MHITHEERPLCLVDSAPKLHCKAATRYYLSPSPLPPFSPLLSATRWLKRLCWSSSVGGSGSHSLVVPIAPVRVVEVNPRRLPVTATRFRSLMPFLRLSPHSPRRCPPNVRLGNFASARPLQAASVHSSARLLERGDKPGGSNGEGGKGGKGDGPKTVPARSLSMSQKDKPDIVDLVRAGASGHVVSPNHLQTMRGR